MTHPSARIPSFLAAFFAPELRAWRGTAPLGEVFWLYGVVLSALQVVLYAYARLEGQLLWEQTLLLGFAGYSAWIVPSLWRCARAVESFWSVLARGLTVAWAANAALVLVFLEVDLLLRHVGS